MVAFSRIAGVVIALGLAVTLTQIKTSNASGNFVSEDRIREHAAFSYGPTGPGAAISITQGNEVLFAEGYGNADLEWQAEITPDTSFRIGSVTKPFTAIAVLQMVSQGKLDLDAQLSTYLPDLPGVLGQPTLRQLLSHTSGLSDHFWLPEIPAIMRNPTSPNDIVALMADAQFMFDPGTTWAYSNFNYVLLGILIEEMDDANRSYGTYIEEEIFAAAGMENSHYDHQSAVIPGRARGYDNAGQGPINTMTAETSLAYAAGALMSSANDMARFTQALVDGTLLSDEMRDAAWTDTALADGSLTGYGLGFNVDTFMGEDIFWHSGSINGFQATWIFVPELDRSVTVLSNGYYQANTTATARRILAELAGVNVPLFDALNFEDATWGSLQGRYRLEDDRILQIHMQDGARYNIDGGSWHELAFNGDGVFFWLDTLAHIRVPTEPGISPNNLTYYSTVLEQFAATRMDGEIEGAVASLPLDTEEAHAAAGDWRLGSGDPVVVSFDGTVVFLQIGGQPPNAIYRSGERAYFTRDAPISIEFAADYQTAELNMYGNILHITRE